jgi:hypothetical protein
MKQGFDSIEIRHSFLRIQRKPSANRLILIKLRRDEAIFRSAAQCECPAKYTTRINDRSNRMNQSCGISVRAGVVSVLGLWIVALPAQATPINWAFGETVSIATSGPTTSTGANASYTSVDQGGGYFNVPAGINSSSTDPTSSLTYSPTPAPPLLSSAALFLSASSSAMNVSASLASGTTHMFASSISGTTLSLDASSVEMEDLLTFIVGGSGTDTITVGFSLDGGYTVGGGASYSQFIQEQLGSALMEWGAAQDIGGPTGPNTSPTTGWNTFSFTSNSLSGFNFLGTLTVTNGEVIPFLYIQQLNCNNGAVCDFWNTGQMSLILPSDVTYTSNSGVFLTQGASTPEPGSIFLIGLGCAAIGLLRHRQSIR